MNQATLSQAYQFYQQNLRNNALTEVEAVLAVAPANAEAHNLRGAVLEGLGRRQEALAAYEESVRLKPDYAAALANVHRLQKTINPMVLPAFGAGDFRGVARIATFLTGLAWVTGFVVACSTFFLFVQSTQYGMDFEDILGPLVIGVLGASLVLLLFAFGQSLRLLINIENSNRQNSELLQQFINEFKKAEIPAGGDVMPPTA
jgi:tetratricopeptide (TPR) repeat protein